MTKEHRKTDSNSSEYDDFLAKDRHDILEDFPKISAKLEILWKNVALHSLLHVGSVFGVYYLHLAQWKTILWGCLLYAVSFISITAGMHRLWAHRTYKAKFPLRAMLVFFNCIANQNDIIEWVTDHRCHHKWSETDGDPHNANRGMFFSHIGWLLVKKHPDYNRRAKTLDLSDLYADKLLVLQQKFFPLLTILFCFVMPTLVPVYLWGESMRVAFFTAGMLRYLISLHATFCVNSVAHKFGYHPYDKKINPAESILTSCIAFGEGFHNYHHTFPQDYRTSEFPGFRFNITTLFIDFCWLLGLAYDRKTVSQERIDKQKRRFGNIDKN